MTRPPSRRRRTPRTAAAALGALTLSTLLIATVTGCSIGPTHPVHAGPPASGIQQPGTEAHFARLYFAGPTGIRAVSRPTDRPLSPQQALDLLLEGPTPAERQRGLISQVPPMAGQLTATATDGAVDVSVPQKVSTGDLGVTAVSQIACTAAHADIRGNKPPTQIDIRIHEGPIRPQTPWTVRCGPNGDVTPVRR
ncbi:GerMN domain-containing protein [Streptomyces sp. NPDC093097]|uniref:GerMN domain-containing protein n=1 Tax=Streptomyces sp. NPDC093097 TaxID=3366027 RepID=UPI0038051742